MEERRLQRLRQNGAGAGAGGTGTGGGMGGSTSTPLHQNHNYTHTGGQNTNSSKLKNGNGCGTRRLTAASTTTTHTTATTTSTTTPNQQPTSVSSRYQRRQSSIVTTNTSVTTPTGKSSGASRNSIGAGTSGMSGSPVELDQPRLSINSTGWRFNSPPSIEKKQRTIDSGSPTNETAAAIVENVVDESRFNKAPQRFNSLSSNSTVGSSKRSDDIINLKT